MILGIIYPAVSKALSCEADKQVKDGQGANDSQVPSTQGQAWSMKSMNLPTPNSQHTIIKVDEQ